MELVLIPAQEVPRAAETDDAGDWSAVEALTPCGGVRIEDDVAGAGPGSGNVKVAYGKLVLRDRPDQGKLPPHTPMPIRKLLGFLLEKDPSERLHHIAPVPGPKSVSCEPPWPNARGSVIT